MFLEYGHFVRKHRYDRLHFTSFSSLLEYIHGVSQFGGIECLYLIAPNAALSKGNASVSVICLTI